MKKIVIILISLILLLSACNGQIDDTQRPQFSIEPGISQPIPTVTSESSDGLVTIQYIPVRTTSTIWTVSCNMLIIRFR